MVKTFKSFLEANSYVLRHENDHIVTKKSLRRTRSKKGFLDLGVVHPKNLDHGVVLTGVEGQSHHPGRHYSIDLHHEGTGEPMGRMNMSLPLDNKENVNRVEMVHLRSKFQGRRIMSDVYRHLMSQGHQLEPSSRQSAGGEAIWRDLGSK